MSGSIYVEGLDIAPLPDLPQSAIDLADGHAGSIIFVKSESLSLDKVRGNRHQVSVMPAHAITIHKAQGITLEKCIIDCTTPIKGNELNSKYVALSRATTSDGIAFLGQLPWDWLHGKHNDELLAEDNRLADVEQKCFGSSHQDPK